MFEETARRVFKVLGRPWTETGAFSCDELPEILRILDEEARRDKERLAQIEAERERKLRESTYDEELRMRERPGPRHPYTGDAHAHRFCSSTEGGAVQPRRFGQRRLSEGINRC